jgi:glucoamylase
MSLDDWISAQAVRSTHFMLRAISATDLVMERSGFGQRIRPITGSVLASPVPGHYDPEPDYFFHWFRDAAVVIDALRVAFLNGYADETALLRFGEFVRFSHTLWAYNGPGFLRGRNLRAGVQPEFLQFLRPETELAALNGPSLLADTRVNADGTPDVTRWSRPQADGPALCAIVLARWCREIPQLRPPVRDMARAVIRADLQFTLTWLDRASFDIWEEENGEHYYTRLVQAEACMQASPWLPERHDELVTAAHRTLERLNDFWDPARAFYRSRREVTDGVDAKELDISVTLAQLHAGRRSGAHCVLDPKAQATITALETLFAKAYAINRDLPPQRAPAMGRYLGDRYFSGGAYYFATLGAAEFYYRLAEDLARAAVLPGSAESDVCAPPGSQAAPHSASLPRAGQAMERADAFMRTIQVFTPPDGSLSEQFDQRDGTQSSARHLAWSYAAFITAAAGRSRARRCLDLLRVRSAVG